ncbi:MAG: polymer-forming cytoskeletal protein [Rhodothermales bacterium]
MTKQSSAAAPNQINMIGEGTTFDGTITAESDIRISGRVMGKIDISGKVIVAQEGVIEGEVRASNLDVAGRIEGTIEVSERVVLKSSAEIEGDIRTARLVIEEGAVFDGRCQMGSRSMGSDEILSADRRKAQSTEDTVSDKAT